MKTHHYTYAHSRGLSKAVQNCVIYNYFLGQMQCFRTKNSIAVAQLTRQPPNCVNCIFGVYKKTQRYRLNVFCLPVDPLSFRHNFDSYDATPKTTPTRTMSLCKLKMAWSDKIRCKMFSCNFYSPSVLHDA